VSEERTEQPTAKRRQDERKKGNIPRSKEFHDALQFGAAVFGLSWGGSYMMARLADRLGAGILAMGDRAHMTITPIDFSNMALDYGASLALVVGPVAIASALGGLVGARAQGWAVSTEPLQPNLSRLSPLRGLQRLKPSRAGIDLARVLIVAVVLGWLCNRLVWTLIEQTPAFGRMAPSEAGIAGWAVVMKMLKQSLLVFFIIGCADYAVRRWQFFKSLRMTKQEVKQEAKETDGNPEIKARVRRIQRQMAQRRMLAAVPKATVVITNPTHYAVALEYKREKMAAPKVVALGADHLAQKIKEVAREHGVPMVENVALARALYASAEIDQPIPMDLFEAVAEVLAYLIRLKQLTL
jgi:flagellar biosynthetic protein FlhB